MSFADPTRLPDDLFTPEDESFAARIGNRLWRWILYTGRPQLGWPILLLTALLSWLPIQAANANEWIVLGEFGNTVAPIGPLGVCLMWLMLGWRQNHSRFFSRGKEGGVGQDGRARLRRIGAFLLILIVGLILITHALVGWIPGPISMTRATFTDGWLTLLGESADNIASIGLRLARWSSGVSAGGATQDDLVFALLAGLIAWGNGLLTGYLVRRRYGGLLCGLPSLWLLILALLYGSAGRMILIVGLLITILLHILLDHERLTYLWTVRKTGYGDGLILDRLIAAMIAAALVLAVAAVMPNLRFSNLAERYFKLYEPINDQVEGFGQRLFPDLKASSRFRGSALSDGLPNSFLLGAGPELSETEVMRVRTDEAMIFEPEILEETPQTGHYVRGGTLTDYDGLGWNNPVAVERISTEADEYVPQLLLSESLSILDGQPELPRGRRLLTQDIFLSFSSRGLYGAGEPLSFSLDYRLDRRGPGDQASYWVERPPSGGGSTSTSSYTVISAVPDVNEAALVLEPQIVANDEDPLWVELSRHLALPDTVTERTIALADELTAGLESPYAKASAIEQYLRGFEYDLTVTQPPDEVTDVADYFLFDLQRGYCDYYATAFIVLARQSGLPTRFSTGFATGRWSSAEALWVVTEAEAHSWPEVYFPSYGWIPFEPTAGRSPLSRVGVGPEDSSPILPILPNVVAPTVSDTSESAWNWQMLFWLLPLGLLGWGSLQAFRWWQRKRQDPWTVILRWGQRLGLPMEAGETVNEYGARLSNFVLERYRYSDQDAGRKVARELETLTLQLTTMQYGSTEHRATATRLIDEQWGVLRGYVSQLS